eukprot:scaffold85977_cov36-Cyclotella_meneghiniana.AAC.1
MEKPISINGLMLIQEKYFQQPQIRLKHTLALAGCSPLVVAGATMAATNSSGRLSSQKERELMPFS